MTALRLVLAEATAAARGRGLMGSRQPPTSMWPLVPVRPEHSSWHELELQVDLDGSLSRARAYSVPGTTLPQKRHNLIITIGT